MREGDRTPSQALDDSETPGADDTAHNGAHDWCIMQSVAGRYYYLKIATNEVRGARPPEVEDCPSCEAYIVAAGLEKQHGALLWQIDQAKPHPSGRSLIVSGAHAGCFASDAASLGAQESEEIEEELNVPHMSRRKAGAGRSKLTTTSPRIFTAGQAPSREGQQTPDQTSNAWEDQEDSRANGPTHHGADDWCIMQSASGRYYFLKVATDEIRSAWPPEVQACPSCQAHKVAAGLEEQHGVRLWNIDQAQPHPSGKSLIVSGRQAGCFASYTASCTAQESEAMFERLLGMNSKQKIAAGRKDGPTALRPSSRPSVTSWMSRLAPASARPDGYALLPGS